MADAVLRELGVGNGGRIVFDRSRVRILVYDSTSSTDVLELLRRCSYQVIALQNARQVIELCRTGTPQVDLILAEVELPNENGFKMLKHFMKEEQLKHIPIVMMSARDEMAVVGKCLRLGAADYLVKPLRTNELFNLWTHMWRRRRMLGLTEKRLISGNLHANDAPVDVLFADTSESNTTSTDFFSEDSNEQARRTVMDSANSRIVMTNNHARPGAVDWDQTERNSADNLSSPPALELSLRRSSDATSSEPISIPDRGPSPPQKTEQKIGGSSAFLAYRHVGKQADKEQRLSAGNDGDEHQPVFLSRPPSEKPRDRQLSQGIEGRDQSPSAQRHVAAVGIPSADCNWDPGAGGPAWEIATSTSPGPNLTVFGVQESLGPSQGVGWSEQVRHGFPQNPVEQLPMFQMHVQNESLMGVPTIPPFAASHHLPPNMLTANMHHSGLLTPALHFYNGLERLPSTIPSIHSLAGGHGHVVPTPPSGFSYYPLHLPIGQPTQMWPPLPTMPVAEPRLDKAERREAALSKFRQKRKDRCFEKKIRYVSRKRLAEQRPRNRGQFVRRNNGRESSEVGDESDEEDEDDECASISDAGDGYLCRVSVCVTL